MLHPCSLTWTSSALCRCRPPPRRRSRWWPRPRPRRWKCPRKAQGTKSGRRRPVEWFGRLFTSNNSSRFFWLRENARPSLDTKHVFLTRPLSPSSESSSVSWTMKSSSSDNAWRPRQADVQWWPFSRSLVWRRRFGFRPLLKADQAINIFHIVYLLRVKWYVVSIGGNCSHFSSPAVIRGEPSFSG